MLHSGENVVDGVPVDVERKRIRRINIRIKPDGRVHLSVPKWWATLKDGEAFLLLFPGENSHPAAKPMPA